MLKKITGYFLLIIVFTVIVFGTVKKYAPIKKEMSVQTDFNETEEEGVTDNVTIEDNQEEINYYAKIGKREFEVLAARISKECSFSKMLDFPNGEIEFADGSLTSPHSFLYLTIKLINNTDEEEEASINNCQIAPWQGEEKGKNVYPYMMAEKQEDTGITYFHVMVAPHTEETVEVLYLIDDTYLDETYDLKLCIDPSGHEGMVLNMKEHGGTEIPYDWSKDVAYIILNELIKEEGQ